MALWRIIVIGEMVKVANDVLRFGAYPNINHAFTLINPIDAKFT